MVVLALPSKVHVNPSLFFRLLIMRLLVLFIFVLVNGLSVNADDEETSEVIHSKLRSKLLSVHSESDVAPLQEETIEPEKKQGGVSTNKS